MGIAFLTLTMLLPLLIPLGAAAQESGGIRHMADLLGKTLAIQTGTSYDTILPTNETLHGDVKLDYYKTAADVVEAVKTGKADATILDIPVAKIYCNKNPELMILPEPLLTARCGYGFRKGSPIVPEFNRALAQLKQEGILEELEAKWTSADDSIKTLMPQDWEPVNGTLRYWIDATYEPISYLGEGGVLLGYDVDVALHIAKIMGVHLEYTLCGYDGLIAALVSGKADMVSSGMNITEERLKSIDLLQRQYRFRGKKSGLCLRRRKQLLGFRCRQLLQNLP